MNIIITFKIRFYLINWGRYFIRITQGFCEYFWVNRIKHTGQLFLNWCKILSRNGRSCWFSVVRWLYYNRCDFAKLNCSHFLFFCDNVTNSLINVIKCGFYVTFPRCMWLSLDVLNETTFFSRIAPQPSYCNVSKL